MTNSRIIYKNNDGGVSVIIPSTDCGMTIDQIAAKDVPAGQPYRIVDVADIPHDRSQRHLWDVDEADLTDGFGADYGVGSANAVVGSAEDDTPIMMTEGQ